MTAALELREVSKRYGAAQVLDQVNLSVPSGSVFGLLGPNGAGKTTTMRLALGLTPPTAGSVEILGVSPQAARAHIGFLPDVPGFYPWMRAPEFLTFAGQLTQVPASELAERVEVLLQLSGLAGVTTKVGAYSRGMKQRLGIAQALINAPEVLFLDEPTSALDPMGRKDVLDMIVALRGRTTVVFSTHILADIERVCDHVALIAGGTVVTQGPLAQLIASHAGAPGLLLGVDANAEQFAAALLQESWLQQLSPTPTGWFAQVSDLAVARRRVPAVVAQLGIGLTTFESKVPTLEDVYVSVFAPPAAAQREQARP